MDYTIDFSLDLHLFFIFALAILIVRNLIILSFEANFIKLAKKIRFPTPAFHFLIASIMFTGVLLITLMQSFNISILLMSIFTIVIMVLEIKRYKKLRVIKTQDIELQTQFKKFAYKIYIIDLILIGVIFLVESSI